jgi:hypothetical protein
VIFHNYDLEDGWNEFTMHIFCLDCPAAFPCNPHPIKNGDWYYLPLARLSAHGLENVTETDGGKQ